MTPSLPAIRADEPGDDPAGPLLARARRLPGVRAGVGRGAEWMSRTFGGWSTFEICATMTLLILILSATEAWYLQIPVGFLAVLGLLIRPVLRRSSYWFCIFGVLAAGYAYRWYHVDNHKYLMTYWCLALGVALLSSQPLRALATNGRLLIGLCFFFATLWKIISPDFPDGTFFHFTLLTDSRFIDTAQILGGVTPQMTAENLRALGQLRLGAVEAVQFQHAPHLAGIALFLAAWTIAIEGLIAVLFLWPRDRGPSRFRDLVLIGFLLSTYPIATVVGFGWLLVAMGITQSSPAFRISPALYVAAFLLLILYNLPFAELLGPLLARLTAG